MSVAQIEIDRLPLHITAATAFDRVEPLRSRMMSALEAHLPVALSVALGPALERDDACVYLDRLRIDCAVDAAWDDAAVASAIARALSQRVLEDIAAGDGVRFADHRDYLAAFLRATCAGNAWSGWWFEAMAGLKLLPCSAVLRSVIEDNGDDGVAAFASLAAEDAHAVVARLDDADALRVLATLRECRESAAAPAPARLREAMEASPGDRSAPHRVLDALASLDNSPGHFANGCLPTLCTLAELQSASRDGRLAVLHEHAPGERFALACCEAIGADPAPLFSWPAEDLRALAASLHPSTVDASEPSLRKRDDAPLWTRHGGAVLLLARLARIGWWHAWRGAFQARLGDAPGDRGAAALALAVVARALDADEPGEVESEKVEAEKVETDTALRALLALDPDAPIDARPWHAALARSLPRVERLRTAPSREARLHAVARALLHDLAAHLPGCADASPAWLRAQCLAFPATLSRSDAGVEARLGRAPLDVLLALAGFTRMQVALPGGPLLSIAPCIR